MKVIDVHLHTNLEKSKEAIVDVKAYGIDFNTNFLMREMKEAGVVSGVSITSEFFRPKSDTPMYLAEAIKESEKFSNLFYVVGINPDKVSKRGLQLLEDGLKNGFIKGLKFYLGYIHYYPYDQVYDKFCKLCIKYDVPLVCHTGDVYDPKNEALLKYSHPLHIDELAVKYPKLKIVMAHIGYPWVRDAVQVLVKNKNVYADLSGLIVGKVSKEKILVKDLEFVFRYVDDSKKFMFGTDWPLVRIKDYLRFMKKQVPKKWHEDVFYKNAKRIFGI